MEPIDGNKETARPVSESGKVRTRINGHQHEFSVGVDMKESETLSSFLRERMGLTGLKEACDEGACGACTIILDGRPVLSCMMLAVEADGCEIRTIEDLDVNDAVVQSFANQCEPGYGTAMQCGYCTPGFVMAAKSLLEKHPDPTNEDIKEAISGHLCRCGCYKAIERAICHAAATIRGEKYS